MSRIVVGVDGSTGSDQALRWAAAEAALRGAELEVVCAWQQPLVPGSLYVDVERDILAGTETIAERARDLVTKEQGRDTVEVTTTVVGAPAAAALLDAAADADLLVVGSHGHGRLSGLLLGSVSLHCVTHSPCPVVVVRYRTDSR
jgi:nucleotide-binding universal stress UspA family protein